MYTKNYYFSFCYIDFFVWFEARQISIFIIQFFI